MLIHNPRKALVFLTAIAVVAGIVGPGLQTALPADTIEGFLWGRALELGYPKHPPLHAWLLHAVEFVAPGQWWLAFVLAQVCVVVAIWAIWQLGRSLLGDVPGALAAALTLAGVYYYGQPTGTFTPDTLSLPLWALILLHFWRAVGEARSRYWYFLAIDIALFVYAKYVVALLVVVLIPLILFTPEGRRALAVPAFWCAVILCAALTTPHLIWLIQNPGPLSYPIDRLHADSTLQLVWFPLKFLAAQLLVHSGLFLLLALLFLPTPGANARSMRSPALLVPLRPLSRFATVFLFVVSLLPIAIVLSFNFIAGVEFRHAWGTPLFATSAILALYLLGPKLELRRLTAASAVAVALVTVPHLADGIVPYLRRDPVWATYPARAAADVLTAEYRKRTGKALGIVVGERRFAGSVALYSKDGPVLFEDADGKKAPWVTQQMLKKDGALIVWPRSTSEDTLNSFRAVVGPFDSEGSVILDWNTLASRRVIDLNWAILRPQT